MALTELQRKQEQSRMERLSGFKRVDVMIINNTQAETELNLALAKINVKYASKSHE